MVHKVENDKFLFMVDASPIPLENVIELYRKEKLDFYKGILNHNL